MSTGYDNIAYNTDMTYCVMCGIQVFFAYGLKIPDKYVCEQCKRSNDYEWYRQRIGWILDDCTIMSREETIDLIIGLMKQ